MELTRPLMYSRGLSDEDREDGDSVDLGDTDAESEKEEEEEEEAESMRKDEFV